MLGLRGFPGVQGGVETHAEHLCPLLVEAGCVMEVITRAGYQPELPGKRYRGVRLRRLWAPRSRSLEAIVHSVLGVLYAGLVRRPDVLHIQAIGPALVTPLARLLGLNVVVTHHGPDYDRQKWGRMARTLLRLGERWGMRHSQAQIVISRGIEKSMRERYGAHPDCIPNGVNLPRWPESQAALRMFGLEPGRYVLLVSRLVPEKRHLDLIAAFAAATLPGWKLVLVGSADHPDAYSASVDQAAAQNANVVCTGFQRGIALQELYAHAGVFVLPSSHEGLPISLLEALSYGLPVIASNIPANLEVGLPDAHYFALGDRAALTDRLRHFAALPHNDGDREARQRWVSEHYNWRDVARQTAAIYRRLTAEN
jgi:glycosyltransferase involved in cell wall biosynthesis